MRLQPEISEESPDQGFLLKFRKESEAANWNIDTASNGKY